jgi:hypothetical protein
MTPPDLVLGGGERCLGVLEWDPPGDQPLQPGGVGRGQGIGLAVVAGVKYLSTRR